MTAGRSQPARPQGWWGIAFVVILFMQAVMVSLPTHAESGQTIQNFYAAHSQLILLQQLLGVLGLIPFVLFALALGAGSRRPLMVAVGWLVVAEVLSNFIPLVIVVTNPSAAAAHGWTVAEDVADAALFVAIAIFALASTLGETSWVRALGWLGAAIAVARVAASPFGIAALDAVAPLAFVALVLVLSIRLLLGSRPATR
jgi:hypothetical protein